MEQPSQLDAHHSIRVMESQIRESYGRVVYSHKVHEKCADSYSMKVNRIRVWQICLSAVTTAGLIATILGDSKIAAAVSAVVSTLLLALNAYTKDYDLGELALKHRDTASKLWGVREMYLSLLTDIASGTAEITEVRERRDRLQASLSSIYSAAPRTNAKAYSAAQAALKVNEDLTFSDEEIDKLLPVALRRVRSGL